MKPEALLQQAKEHYEAASEAWQAQITREKDDLRFQVPEFHWTEKERASRAGVDGSSARPTLAVSKLDQPIKLIINQQRAAHLGINLLPLSPRSDDDMADICLGLYRKIERDSQAHIARSWAFDRKVKCGRAWYRILTDWDPEGEDKFDQRILIRRILYQENVLIDPTAEEQDFSDARYAFVITHVPIEEFKRLYPKANASTKSWDDLASEAPKWITGAGKSRAVVVAEYFWKDSQSSMLYRFEDGTTAYEDELAALGLNAKDAVKSREYETTTVRYGKMTGVDVLEEGVIPGELIPLVPDIGDELQPIEGERFWAGIISPAKDPQKVYDYAISNMVETAQLEPKAPYVGAVGQFETDAHKWETINTRNWDHVEYDLVEVGGQPVGPPQRTTVDAQRLGFSMQLGQQATQDMQSATAAHDPSLGRLQGNERSGKAIQALQQQFGEASSHYLQNTANISMQYEARVILGMFQYVYDRPGRRVRVIDADDETESVLLNQPYIINEQTKELEPVEVQRDEDGQPIKPMVPINWQPQQPDEKPPKVYYYDLSKAKFSIAVSVGKTRQTLAQEGAEQISNLMESMPQAAPVLAPIFAKFSNFPGMDEVVPLLVKLRDKAFPGIADDDDDVDVNSLKAQNEQMQQQLQQLQQALQQATSELSVEQLKAQTSLQGKQIDAQSRVEAAQVNAEGAAARQQIKAASDERIAALEQQVKMLADHIKGANDAEKLRIEAAPKITIDAVEKPLFRQGYEGIE
jgi:hypothetical protein